MARTRRDVPVDVAHVVARLVLADLGELHPLSAEHALVLAAEDRCHDAARAQLDLPHLAQYVPCRRRCCLRRGLGRAAQPADHGTSTAAKTRVTMSSDVTSSASASKLVMIRWRSTSGPIDFTSSGNTYPRPWR